MANTSHFQVRKQSLITHQDVLYVLILIAICLWFSLVPTPSFGQPLPGHVAGGAFPVFGSSLDSDPLPVTAATAEPAPAFFMQTVPAVPAPAATFHDAAPSASPAVEPYYVPAQPEVPIPVTASVTPVTANQLPQGQHQFQQPLQQPLQRSVQHEIAVNTEHPFRQYWGIPNDPQTKITGKPMSVVELFAGTRSSAVRCQLLQAYWELSGLLAVYHFRCETERLASGAAGMQQEGMMTLLREQRRTAEVEFIKQQWILAEMLKQYKGRTLRASELPIPADYPLYPRYQTYADKIARTERTQYLGRMIPIQEQLIETKNGTWKAASEMVQSASQPLFAVSNQRTTAFLDLTNAIIEYNKMIAEYALETIPPNVSPYQLAGAVVRLPRGGETMPVQPQTQRAAMGEITLTQYEMPPEVTAQPVEQVAHEFQPEFQPALDTSALLPDLR